MNIKRQIVFIISILILLLASGCSSISYETENKDFLFNRSSLHLFESDDYIVLNIEPGYLYDIKTEKVIPLTLDPLERFGAEEQAEGLNASDNTSFFVSQSNVYILDNLTDEWSTSTDFKIEVLNLKTLSKTALFQTQKIDLKDNFLGLTDLFGEKNTFNFDTNDSTMDLNNSWGVFHFFVYNNVLYTIENYQLHSYNLQNGKRETIIDDRIKGESIACDGKNIYYLTITNDLFAYNIEEKSKNKIVDDKVSDFYVSKDYIIYNNVSDNGFLYRYDKSTSVGHKISEAICTSIQTDGQNIYYIDSQSGDLCCMTMEGEEVRVLIEQDVSDFIVLSQKNNIIFTTENNSSLEQSFGRQSVSIYISDKQGSNQHQIKL